MNSSTQKIAALRELKPLSRRVAVIVTLANDELGQNGNALVDQPPPESCQ
jgi:hypothetical protein